MAVGTVRNIERSIHKTNQWLKDVAEELSFSEEQAYIALRATLHMLRDRVTVDEATDFASQLPMVIQGIYYEGWKPANKPEKMDKTAFVSRVHSHFNNDPDTDPEKVIEGVLRVLHEKASDGEIKDMESNVPKDIRELFYQAFL
jgi:uncharacterized protein (DUF2267 family)